jgi:HAD superfamily hydrolase (TIGR01549 family)
MTPAAVLFDFSGTLFFIESAREAVVAALGAEHASWAPELARLGAINGSSTPAELPESMRSVWERRDHSAAAHRAAYSGMSRAAGLDADQAHALYERGLSAQAWTAYEETLPVLRDLRVAGVPVALVSNIGWDPVPVLDRWGARPYLDALVLSYELGAVKPEPAVFAAACERLGVAPGPDVVMVGDNAEADGGAAALGIRFALVPADPAARTATTLHDAVDLRPGH